MEQAIIRRLVEEMRPADRSLYYPEGDQKGFWARVQASGGWKAELEDIRREGGRLLEQAIPELTYSLFVLYAKQGTRLEYERVYFERRRRLNTFAVLSMLEPEQEEWKQGLFDVLWAVCGEYTWCLPAHLPDGGRPETIDLFAAETGFTLNEIALLLENMLPGMLKDRIAREVEQRIIRPFLEAGPWHWETVETNWSAVCAGSVGAAALLQPSISPEDLAAVLTRAERSMEFYFRGFGDDGVCLEGPGYWNYGFGYFVYYADLLRSRTEGRIDHFNEEKVRNIALFQQRCFLSQDRPANFSDAVRQVRIHPGLSHYLSRCYPEVQLPPAGFNAMFSHDPCSRWAHAFRDLIWREPEKERAGDWQSAAYLMRGAQWLVARWPEGGVMRAFAAKGGTNGEPHNHNDVGHFILVRGGEAFLTDLGSGEYTSSYFGEKRYTFDCNGAQGHSLPIIDGMLQAEGAESAAVLLAAEVDTAVNPHMSEVDTAVNPRMADVDQAVNPHMVEVDSAADPRVEGEDLEASYEDTEAAGAPDAVIAGSGRSARMSLELAAAYRVPSLRSLVRTFDWNAVTEAGPELRVTDRFRFDSPPRELVERFVTQILPLAEEAGGIRLEGAGGTLRIGYDAARLEPRVNERFYRNHAGVDEKWYTLDFAVKKPESESSFTFEFSFD
ncbi:hypothetical protein ACE6ED_05125 [Paenibacillus sp. CN-4]|uniref:hypothetical protein n=1 Tax=Paenibacillus nanchangensis TaxID=3348343 RepID=UPI00397A30B6